MAKTENPKLDEQVPAMEELQKTLRLKEELLQKQTQVLSNPQVQKALRAVAEGKELDIVEEKETVEPSMKALLGKKPKEVIDEDTDLDALSNSELVDIISYVVDKYVGETKSAADTAYEERLGLINGKIDKTNELLLGFAANKTVSDLEAKHADFDAFKPAMTDIINKYPNMAIEDAYTLAKGSKLISSPSPQHTESEKPESSSLTPAWVPVHLRNLETGDKTKSDGVVDTPLRMPYSNSRNFRAMVSEAAQRRS